MTDSNPLSSNPLKTALPARSRAAAADMLRWYQEMGVDAAVAETPRDWIDRPDVKAQTLATGSAAPHKAPLKRAEDGAFAQQNAKGPPTATAAAPGNNAVDDARRLAKEATTLEQLREAVSAFTGCNLKTTAKNTVFADGDGQARVMFVGEAPGRDEDIQGVPFVGRSGQLLNKMLAAIQVAREDTYITNVLPWRPPGNRTPTPAETEICRPFIERQIALVDPDILVLLGGAAAKQLLATTTGIMKLRGRWRNYETPRRTIRAMATFHPAYLLRTPGQKRLAWRDFRAIKTALEDK